MYKGINLPKQKAFVSLGITGWPTYNRLTSCWGTCARTEGGVFMYLSKQSEDQRPRTLISHGGKLAEAAVLAAPIRKLCPTHYEIHEDLKSWTPADVLRLNHRTSAEVLVYSTRSLTVGMKFLDASSKETC